MGSPAEVIEAKHRVLACTLCLDARCLEASFKFAARALRALAEANFGSVGRVDSPFEGSDRSCLDQEEMAAHNLLSVADRGFQPSMNGLFP